MVINIILTSSLHFDKRHRKDASYYLSEYDN